MTDVIVTIRAKDRMGEELSKSEKRLQDWANKLDKTSKSYLSVERQKQAALKQTADAEQKAAQQTAAANQKMVENIAKATAAFVAMGAAAKKAYDFAKQGAEIEFTKIKFDRLAKTIGTTGDALLTKLRPATRGVMSDMELIGSATDTMSLGLVRNEKDAIRLTTVMAGLGMDMNQVVLALSNQTTMRFDQLGVAVTGFDEKVKALEATGMDANAAFTEAFLQQAEEQLQKVGHAADTTAGSFMQLEASFKNLSDSMKEDLAQAIGPSIAAWNDYRQAAQEVNDELGNMPGMARNQLAAMKAQTEAARENAEQHDATAIALERGAAMTQFYSQQVSGELTPALEEAAMSQAQFRDSMSELSQFMRTDLTDAQNNYNASIAELQTQLSSAKESERGDIIAQIEAETQAYNERATAIMFNIQQQGIMAAAESGQIDFSQAAQAVSALAENYGLIDENTKAAMDATQGFIDQFAETGNMDAFLQNLSLMQQYSQEAVPAVDASTSSVQDFASKTQEAVEALLALPPSGTTWEYTFDITGGQNIPNAGGGGGSSASNNTQMMATGGQMGAGWTLVGEAGPELISPSKWVYTASQTRAIMSRGFTPGKSRRVGGSLDDPAYDPTDVLVFGPSGSGNAINSPLYNTDESGGSSSSSSIAATIPAAVAEVIAQPLVSGVSQVVNEQSVRLQASVLQMTNETKTTNALLKQLVAKTASEGGIAKAVRGQEARWNG